MLWIKQRSGAAGVSSHVVKDSSRGVSAEIYPNATTAEGSSGLIDALLADGFSIDNTANDHYNYSSALYVSWQWKANGGSTTTNDASATGVGGIDSVYQANTTAGFSIVTWTGSGGNTTIAHGLGTPPRAIIIKNRNLSTQNWFVNFPFGTGTGYLMLNKTDASDSPNSTVWNNTAPTSSVISLGTTQGVNGSSDTYVAYCFAEVQGYSKFGGYTGNGNADGPFVYTGFKPAWVMIKRTDATNSWVIRDSGRSTFNVMQKALFADLTNAESDSADYNFDFLSNGFKQRNANGIDNADAGTYVYMAFAEQPFVTSGGVPCTAR